MPSRDPRTKKLPLPVLAVAVLLSGVAAGAPQPRLVFKEMPVIETAELPAFDKRPASVQGSVDGIKITISHSQLPKKRPAKAMPGQQQVQVGGDSGDLDCLAVAAMGRENFKAGVLFLDASEGVLPVRSERLVESGGEAVLKIRDLWVDPLNATAVEIKRSEIKLSRLASGPIDSAAWGFRSKRGLEVIVPTGGSAQLTGSDGQFFNTSCQHLQAHLPIDTEKKEDKKDGDKAEKADKGDKGKGVILQGFFSKLTPLEPGNDKDGDPPPPQRLIRIGLAASASQSSKDPDPLISVVLRALDEVPEPRKSKGKK